MTPFSLIFRFTGRGRSLASSFEFIMTFFTESYKKRKEETKKRVYISPEIQLITLDNEISLQLASDPPVPPGDEVYNKPEYFNNDPYKVYQV